MRILVTGGAGFIGSHLTERLLAEGHEAVVIDSFAPLYDPEMKRRNMAAVFATAGRCGGSVILCEGDIRDHEFVSAVFADERPEAVVHFAAMAGVRPSIEQPLLYEEVNVRGTMHLLEAARAHGVRPFLFASSSSVYGENPKVPFAETDPVDHPISPYAATKKAGELICHTYHHLHGLSVACLRFFTVYGPRQRPDLAIHKFTRLILAGEPVPFFGDGSTSRDYTYVDDIVDGVMRALAWATSGGGYDIFNLGGSRPVTLSRLVAVIEEAIGTKAVLDRQGRQAGDVSRTFADLGHSGEVLGYVPTTPIEEGVRRFVAWYRENAG